METSKTNKTISSKYIICPKCNKYPYLSISRINIKEILINCNHCGYKSTEKVFNYLNEIASNTRCEDISKKCTEHNRLYSNFCVDCNLHFCEKCNNNHSAHQIINLTDNILNKNVNKKLNEEKNHIQTYCYNLKNSKIQELLTEIRKLEYCYQLFKFSNENLLQLVKLIADNYQNNSCNYYLKNNYIGIQDIINSKSYKIKGEKITTDDIINYYTNYSMFGEKDYLINISKIHNIKTLTDHCGGVFSVILLKDGRLASCSKDRSIRIFSIQNDYHCDAILKHQATSILSISQLENGKLVGCCGDNSIKIWNINDNYSRDFTISKAHSSKINTIISLSSNRMASCSEDGTIKMWSTDTPYKLINTLQVEESKIISIIQIKNKEYIVSAGSNGKLQKWNLKTYQCDTIINDVYCYSNASLLELLDNRLIIGEKKGVVIVGYSSCRIEQRINHFTLDNVYSLMQLNETVLLFGYGNGAVCALDLKNNTVQIKNNIHDGHITSMVKKNEQQFVTSSLDKTLKVWEI